jgi:hypothetical protein
VPQGTALKDLAPVITINGASVSPASGEAQDFFTASGYSPVVYTVTGEDASEALWTVTVRWEPTDDIATYLGGLPENADGGVSGGPVILPVSVDLSGNGWSDLLTMIRDASSVSTVALDLSACAMGGAVFDPGTADTGESKIVSLVLPDAATSIKAGTYSDPTFKHFTALKNVMGEAVTSIGSYAFSGCTGLTSVDLPAATTIGYAAFSRCTGLTSVDLPAATSIGFTAFYGCTGLMSVNLPAATSIDGSAFSSCFDLTSVDLPAATFIGDSAFSDCTSLTTVSLPAVASIGHNAFYNCAGLTAISLPASLTSIEGNPFTWCPGLSISVAAANLNYKVEGENKLLTKDGATLVGWPSASGDVTLSGITTVGNGAFEGCTGLTAADLPAATSIGYYSFGSCTGLETVSLPAATSIGDVAFANTETTASLAITLGDTPPELGMRMFSGVPLSGESKKTVTVEVPAEAAGYAALLPATYSDGENTTGGPHWGEGFRGKGWTSGGAYVDSEYAIVNENITLTIEVQEETL